MNTSNLIDKAQTLIVEEQFDEALGICDEVIDKLRHLLGNAMHVKGLALTRDKGFSDAAATSNKSTEMEPTVFDALLKQGLSFMQEGEWACALTAIDEGLHRAEKTNERDNATWWHLKGEAHRNLEQFDEALLAFEKAIELGFDDKAVFLSQALVFSRLKQYDNALAALKKSEKLKHSNPDWLPTMGAVLVSMKREREALIVYEEAAQLFPEDYRVWFGMGNCLRHNKQFESAIKSYDQALKIKPGSRFALLMKFYAHSMLREFEKCLSCLDNILRKSPDDIDARRFRGETLWMMERDDEALQVFNHLLELNPEDEKAMKSKERVLNGLCEDHGRQQYRFC